MEHTFSKQRNMILKILIAENILRGRDTHIYCLHLSNG